MAQPDFLPSSGGGEFGEQDDNVAQLIGKLQAFAENNPDFKEGQEDFVGIEIEGGKRIADIDYPGRLKEWSYQFSAIRHRSPGNGSSLHFELSQVNRESRVQIPVSILEGQLGLSAIEAAKGVKAAIFELEVTYRIATDDESLAVCETYTYFDTNAKVIHSICSCGEDHYESDSTPSDSSGRYPEDMLSTIVEDLGAVQLDSASYQELVDLALGDDEQQAGELDSLGLGYIFNDDEKDQENAAAALELLHKVRRAVLVQAGAANLGPMAMRNETGE